jgi:hypothetical protein
MAKKNNSGTTLQDLQFSMNGEPTLSETPSPEPYYAPTVSGHIPAQPTEEWVIFKLVNTKKKGRIYIDGIDDVINPETKKLERIILLTGAPSIWAKDLVELLKDKDYVRRNRRSLMFEGGVLRVPAWDTQMLEWIRHCRHCIDNPSRRSGSKYEFFEYNPERIARAQMEREMLELDMAIAARELKIEQARKIAAFLNISFTDELGRPKVDDAIRRDLMLRAKKDPVGFKKLLNSREVEVGFLVQSAILDAKIDLANREGAALWAGTGGFIARIPRGRSPKEHLTELALSHTEEGKAFLEQLQSFIQ